MRRLGERARWGLLVCWLGACGAPDWSGDFEGLGNFTWSRTVMTSPPDANGSATANSSRGSGSGGRVSARRVDERHYVLTTPYCDLRTEQNPDPNQHNGQIVPGQTCTFPVGDTEITMPVTGTLMFGVDNPTLHLDFGGSRTADANGIPGGDSAQFSWTFDGRRPGD